VRFVAEQEQIQIDRAGVEAIARRANGGLRDALSLLDQVLSACGQTPTDEEVAEALGAIDRTMVQDLARALVDRDAKLLLERAEEAFNRGVDLKRLMEELALELRHVFVAKTLAPPAELAELDRKAAAELASRADAAQLARLFDVVHGSVYEVSRASSPKLALEMALLKAVHLSPAASIPELIAKVERLASGKPAEASRVGAPGGRSAQPPFRV
jgi:DNA polymerase-3 subunit gamma/tau